jgi:hypothetical protein
MLPTLCKTVGLSYAGSNPTPATTQTAGQSLFRLHPTVKKGAVRHTAGIHCIAQFLQVIPPGCPLTGQKCPRHGEYTEKFSDQRTVAGATRMCPIQVPGHAEGPHGG